MRFQSTTLEQRKHHVRDIISSFDRMTLPLEFRADVFARIDEEQAGRSQSEWTRQGDLTGTAMQWGSHDPASWETLNRWQPPSPRAKLFAEKLRRLFDDQFKKYDDLGSVQAQITTAGSRTSFDQICDRFHKLTQATVVDLRFRTEGHAHTADVLLDVLARVCRSQDDISEVRRSPRSPTASATRALPQTSLYHVLIHEPALGTTDFMLEALETLNEVSPRTLAARSMRQRLQTIDALLRVRHAPFSYQTRLREVINN
ncbi:hypothetical protein A1O1_01522 [Capronia coronata CBS 617.96]|uniref:Uncharacterized protein n=1 Tax=Capronia coronata CBS 617.96 TaxID=1182541 RepID=W9Z495_9EURO|nr:uncharacterized protein A1O1_01522 [Capronia coronata CBS 617.96]EXJ96396.1 hypothetical protein A1O1_01522 [Capronia coronata CBS 617.96]